MTLSARRRLRRGASLWSGDSGTSVRSTPLPSVVLADVLVVGAGISGALVSRALRLSGREVVVVDRRKPLSGSTIASTALLQYELDLPLHRLAERVGWSNAQRVWRRAARAVQDLGAIVRADQVHCQFSWRDSLYVAGTQYGQRALRREATARERAGLPATFLDRQSLYKAFGIDRTGAILAPGAAVAHPARLTAGLLRRSAKAGMRIYHDANVDDVTALPNGVMLTTEDGRVMVANHAVFCCGYEVPRLIPRGSHRIKSTWAIAARVQGKLPVWLRQTVLWEASNPYLYLRAVSGNTIVAGGRDEQNASSYSAIETLAQKARLLTGDLRALLPSLSISVTHQWGGAFGETASSLPLIDRLPGHSRAWVVAGFGGNGITFSVVASQIMAAALQGHADPDAKLFRLEAHQG